MSTDDDIGFTGPDLVYRPQTGSNVPKVRDAFRTPQQRSYADRSELDRLLSAILAEGARFGAELEEILLRFAMPIPRGDTRLEEANRLEWPSALGTPQRIINYRFYRALATRPTTAASYVRARFEDAVRDFAGTNALDILSLIDVIVDEARLVKDFVVTYIGNVDDTSELRTVELFQDWASAAVIHLDSLHNVRSQVGLHALPARDVQLTTPVEARQAQAAFKVKLNAVNREISDSVSHLRKNFSEHAATFYGRFLGPAFQWRLTAGRSFHTAAGVLGAELTTTGNSLDANLSVLQADQLRRNLLFDSKVGEVTDQVQRQDAYREYINQLAVKGKPVPDTVMEVDEDPDMVAYFEDLDEDVDQPIFEPLHSALAGLLERAAHPQYLVRDGDVLTGDLEMDDGVLLDGMDPSEHRHTGADGTRQVQGTDIAGGTLPPGVVDRNIKPEKPIGLHLISQVGRVIPPGMTVIDATVGWEGEVDLQYEVQTVVIPP